jgi:hypothetical protein
VDTPKPNLQEMVPRVPNFHFVSSFGIPIEPTSLFDAAERPEEFRREQGSIFLRSEEDVHLPFAATPLFVAFSTAAEATFQRATHAGATRSGATSQPQSFSKLREVNLCEQ